MVRIGMCVVREPMTSTAICTLLKKNVARYAFGASTTTAKYITLFALDQFRDLPGVYVSITV